MIDPSECFVAPISAAKEMTLILPRSQYEYRCLIAMSGDKPISICLDEVHQLGRFLAFECTEKESWKGIHVPGVRIELDEASIHDAEGYQAPKGSMIRFEDKLALRVRFEANYQTHGITVIICDNLPLCAPYMSACFLKWQIVLGEGEEKRVLAKVDATPAAS
jgi:hypothetical protein